MQSSPPFYTKCVYLPLDTTPIPDEIQDNPKLYPFFKGALGAIDDTHINVAPLLLNSSLHATEKESVSQSCLACCTFDLWFQYMLSGLDGSAADAAVYNDACQTDLTVLAGKFCLADAGCIMEMSRYVITILVAYLQHMLCKVLDT